MPFFSLLLLCSGVALARPALEARIPAQKPKDPFPFNQCDNGKFLFNNFTTSNFDNLQDTVPDVSVTATPENYNGLSFPGFEVIQTMALPAQAGVIPHSPRVYIGTSLIPQVLHGGAQISTQFPGSRTVGYNPLSFYYGCAIADENGLASAPIACSMTFTGYRGSDDSGDEDEKCAFTRVFRPSGATSLVNMAFTEDVSGLCKPGITFGTFTYAAEDEQELGNSLLVLLIDDFRAEEYYCKYDNN